MATLDKSERREKIRVAAEKMKRIKRQRERDDYKTISRDEGIDDELRFADFDLPPCTAYPTTAYFN